jgi:hypothetical protein
MTPRYWMLLVCLLGWATNLLGQGSKHNLQGGQDDEDQNRFKAFLTLNQTDEWILDGVEGETLVAHVVTKEFDPILGIAKKIDKQEDEVLLAVDDEGSESRFVFRLREKGRFAIRIHAFKNQGGGNYELFVERFAAKPIKVGEIASGNFDKKGNAHFYFDAKKGQILVPSLINDISTSLRMLDIKGKVISDWAGSSLIEEDGEYRLRLSGRPERSFELRLTAAQFSPLEENKVISGTLQAGQMEVWSFPGKPGDVRLIEVERTGRLNSRLIDAKPNKKTEHRFEDVNEEDRKAIEALPIGSRGSKLRYAVILGRDSEYQFQVIASEATDYKMKLIDPRAPIEFGKPAEGNIAVGGTAFYRWDVKAGQLCHLKLASQQFVPVFRLYDSNGELFSTVNASDDELIGRETHLSTKEGTYLLQVSSQGDGGGGAFQIDLTETKLKEIKIGGRYQGRIESGVTEYWVFDGKEGQSFFLHARSEELAPHVNVQSPDGEQTWTNQAGSEITGTLLALKLTKTGRYTIGVSANGEKGDYMLRVIDAD